METDIERWGKEQGEKGAVKVTVHAVPDRELRYLIGQEFDVVCGDRHEAHGRDYGHVLVRVPSSFEGSKSTRIVSLGVTQHAKIVQGHMRDVYFPGGIRIGTYGTMGAIAKGIRSGRFTRGR